MASVSVYVFLFSLLLSFLFTPLVSDDSFKNNVSGPLKILLLTAHPDDECLFFAPTILSLVQQAKASSGTPEIFSMCLSTGDSDGLGDIRRVELSHSLDILGIELSRRKIVDHPALQDNITSNWDPDTIANVVQPYVLKNGITTILTFDYEGISSHPNHKSLPAGAKRLIATYPTESLSPRPRLFTLITVPLVSKYTSVLAPTMAKFDLYAQRALHYLEVSFVSILHVFGVATISTPREEYLESKPTRQSLPVFVSGAAEYQLALKAMSAHGTQLVWFRWLYVLFSRYMWVNEWVEVKTDA